MCYFFRLSRDPLAIATNIMPAAPSASVRRVIEHLRSGFFRCELPLIARTSAMMLRHNIKVTSGDIVRVVLDGHGLSHGRITYHYSEAS